MPVLYPTRNLKNIATILGRIELKYTVKSVRQCRASGPPDKGKTHHGGECDEVRISEAAAMKKSSLEQDLVLCEYYNYDYIEIHLDMLQDYLKTLSRRMSSASGRRRPGLT